MSNTQNTQTPANVSTVRKIGTGVRLTEEAVPQIIASLPDGFDPKARGAVATAVHVWATGTDDTSAWPKVKTGAKGEQVTTDYGTGHDTLTRAVKKALAGDTPKPVRLAVTMSGDGAPATGTVQIPTDHALYDTLVALLAESAAESAADAA